MCWLIPPQIYNWPINTYFCFNRCIKSIVLVPAGTPVPCPWVLLDPCALCLLDWFSSAWCPRGAALFLLCWARAACTLCWPLLHLPLCLEGSHSWLVTKPEHIEVLVNTGILCVCTLLLSGLCFHSNVWGLCSEVKHGFSEAWCWCALSSSCLAASGFILCSLLP